MNADPPATILDDNGGRKAAPDTFTQSKSQGAPSERGQSALELAVGTCSRVTPSDGAARCDPAMVEGQDLRGDLEVGVVVDQGEAVFGGQRGGE